MFHQDFVDCEGPRIIKIVQNQFFEEADVIDDMCLFARRMDREERFKEEIFAK